MILDGLRKTQWDREFSTLQGWVFCTRKIGLPYCVICSKRAFYQQQIQSVEYLFFGRQRRVVAVYVLRDGLSTNGGEWRRTIDRSYFKWSLHPAKNYSRLNRLNRFSFSTTYQREYFKFYALKWALKTKINRISCSINNSIVQTSQNVDPSYHVIGISLAKSMPDVRKVYLRQ